MDDAGGIMRVEIGLNGVFGDPQPFAEAFSLELPSTSGPYTIAARLYDRAGNATVVSDTLTLDLESDNSLPSYPVPPSSSTATSSMIDLQE
jgi:hypothetical protein